MKAVVLDGFTLTAGDLSWIDLQKLCDVVIYASTDADKVIEISKSFNIDAQIVGRIEEGKRSLTIQSEFGTFNY